MMLIWQEYKERKNVRVPYLFRQFFSGKFQTRLTYLYAEFVEQGLCFTVHWSKDGLFSKQITLILFDFLKKQCKKGSHMEGNSTHGRRYMGQMTCQ